MGLSSSQARLLTLTGRMHDIEYKAARLEAQKLQMANESRRVYGDYLAALDATKIQMKTINNDGSLDYIDATYNVLMGAGYKLSMSGSIIVSQADIDYFNDVAHGNAIEFACLKSGYAVKDGTYTVLASDPSIGLAFTETGLQELVSGDKNIALMDNITVNTSLGTYKKTLDGNGKTLTVANNDGAFSYLKGATITNLNLTTKEGGLNSTSTFGGILAQQVSTGTTTLENISVSGSATSTNYFGGLVGRVGGTLNASNITANVQIEGTSDGSKSIGGLVGVTTNTTTVTNVDMTATLRGTSIEGGIVGCAGGSSTTIQSCYVNIDAIGTNGKGIAGIAGNISNYTVIDSCYVEGSVIGSAPIVVCTGAIAGDVGLWYHGTSPSITNCYADIVSTATTTPGTNEYAGDIIGAINNASYVGMIVDNVASQNGTSSSVVSPTTRLTPNPSGVQDTFTEAADANAVKDAVLVATANAGSSISTTYTPPNTDAYNNFYEIGLAIQEGRTISVDGMEDNPEWLANMLNGGTIILQKKDKNGEYYDTSVAIDTSLQEVSDESDLRKAEAKYEADMRKIDAKDRKYDTDLAALDAERNAIKAEMETLKSVAKDNVERTFKLFS